MQTNATKNYYYTGDWYGYKIKTGAEGIEYKEYTQVPQQVTMLLSVNLLGDLVIESETKMQLNSYIKNIVDQNDEEIYTDGEWRIFQTAPVLGPMGLKAGYRYRATIIAGNV
jgi:hypothetical protein